MRQRGFTLIELMVVVAMIALLAAILAPSIVKARTQAQQTACMSNLRQLTQAYLAYTNDYDGTFLFLDSTSTQAGIASGSNNSMVIQQLYPYVQSSRAFHCPADPRDDALSYAPNAFLGPKFTGGPGTWPAYTHPIPRLQMVSNAAGIYAMIEKYDLYPRTSNDPGAFVVEPAPATIWIDTPGIGHGRGTCVTFLDGHCDFWLWSDPRTLAFPPGSHMVRTPGNADLARLQAVLGGF